MWLAGLVLGMALLPISQSYFFEVGLSHHYTYWAVNSLIGQHNVTTVLKVLVEGARRY